MSKRSGISRFAGWVLLAAVLVAAGFALRPAPLAVEIGRVERGDFSVTVDEQGRTRARHRYVIAAPVAGRLLRTTLDEGDRVAAGDELLRIAPPPEDLRTLGTAKAELEVAQAREHEARALFDEAAGLRARAEREARRRAELHAKGMVSIEMRELYAQLAESASAREASARAALLAAAADVERARVRLLGAGLDADAASAALVVRAPVGGRVLRVLEESERVVAAGTPLLELSDGDAVEIVIDLLTQDAVRVGPGDRISITDWGGERALGATVRLVEPGGFMKISALGVEEQRVNVIADLDETPAGLGFEFRVEAAIVAWTGNDVLTMPASALFRRNGEWQVFSVEDGRARLGKVRIGQRGVEKAEVLEGLDEGASVIVYPSDLVADGVRVRRRD